MLARVASWLALLARADAAKNVEILWSVPDFIDTGLGCQVGEFPES